MGLICITGMEPPSGNHEYELIKDDDSRYSKEELELRANAMLYVQNCHKLWKPWVFGTIGGILIVLTIDGFMSFGLLDVVIGFMINSPIACIINFFQIRANDHLRDIYRVNTEELRREAKLEEAMCLGAAFSTFNTNRKTLSDSLKPHDLDI